MPHSTNPTTHDILSGVASAPRFLVLGVSPRINQFGAIGLTPNGTHFVIHSVSGIGLTPPRSERRKRAYAQERIRWNPHAQFFFTFDSGFGSSGS